MGSPYWGICVMRQSELVRHHYLLQNQQCVLQDQGLQARDKKFFLVGASRALPTPSIELNGRAQYRLRFGFQHYLQM